MNLALQQVDVILQICIMSNQPSVVSIPAIQSSESTPIIPPRRGREWRPGDRMVCCAPLSSSPAQAGTSGTCGRTRRRRDPARPVPRRRGDELATPSSLALSQVGPPKVPPVAESAHRGTRAAPLSVRLPVSSLALASGDAVASGGRSPLAPGSQRRRAGHGRSDAGGFADSEPECRRPGRPAPPQDWPEEGIRDDLQHQGLYDGPGRREDR